MDRHDIITILRQHEHELHRQGVMHAGLFGSRVRGEARPDSDIDILVDLDPAVGLSVFDYVGLKTYIANLFEGPVDVISRDGLKPYVKPAVLAEVLYAF